MVRKWMAVVVLLVALLCIAGAFQALHDREMDGGPGVGNGFLPADALVSALGGIRQYLAYVFFIKTDNLHHAYYGSIEHAAEVLPYLVAVSYLDPNYVDAFYVGSEILYDLGRREEAIQFNMRGLESNPESGDLMASLADIYLREKRYREAAELFREALRAKDKKILSEDFLHMGLVASLKAMGDVEGALRALEERISHLNTILASEDLDWETRAGLVKGINDLENRWGEMIKIQVEGHSR